MSDKAKEASSRLLGVLKDYKEKHGLMKAAQHLGLDDTSRIIRWIREDRLPAAYHILVLDMKKEL